MTKSSVAVVILGQQSVPVARQLMTALPGAKLYGLAGRTTDVDVHFDRFGDTLRELFSQGIPIVGLCAAGILIRTLAPLLSDKRAEPPVLAIAEDGSAVVPLLGGLNGVNDLARKIAAVLAVNPAITTTGEVRFGLVLENPPPGYHLANPEHAKSFMSDLLSGATVKLEGTAPWLSQSTLAIAASGSLTIQITEQSIFGSQNCLVYHPATVAIAISDTANIESDKWIKIIQQRFTESNLAVKSIAGIFSPTTQAANPCIHAIAYFFNVPARFFLLAQPDQATLSDAITQATLSQLLTPHPSPLTLAIAPHPIDATQIGQPQGKLAIVGTGPGGLKWMSPEVKDILHAATDLVGYTTYLNLIGSLADGKQRHDSDNREEEARARLALDLAAEGRSVVVVSSGDPGIYAMATAIFEVFDREAKPEWNSIDIRVSPGISAMQAAAALIGAPIGHDFCAISLSDILKPWSMVAQRITAAVSADFVIAFYNPISSQRTWQLSAAIDLLREQRSPDTPVVLARNVGRPGQSVKAITLKDFTPDLADMRTVILIGSSKTRTIQRGNNTWVYTPRRYDK
jgi:cobalt-precorrin 5A hydrolase / precorrin-3B C17-methyltransferase